MQKTADSHSCQAVAGAGSLQRTPLKSNRPKRNPNTSPICVDLCCGLGGLSLAAKSLKCDLLLGVDVNGAALKTFERNFPNVVTLEGDIREEDITAECAELVSECKEPEQPLLIVSGPPCQGFSVAGKRDPNDWRNAILIAVARAIVRLRPDAALVENVAAVLLPQHARTVSTFSAVLERAGYHVTPTVLDAQSYGLPQRRRRVFFFITKEKMNEPALAAVLKKAELPATTVEAALAGLPVAQIRPESYVDEQEKGGLFNHLAMRHSAEVSAKIAALLPGTGPLSYRRLDLRKPANTLLSGHRAPPAHPTEPRSITVREAARLQGFPDSFRVFGVFASQMEQVTNAVPPPMAEAALRALLSQALPGHAI